MSHTHGGPADHAADGPAVRQHDPRKARRALLGAYVGTSLEWYDFFLFGTTSSIVFAPLFFGGDDPALRVIQSFLLFGIGFIARPIGALLAGHFGDRLGRRTILMITIVAMGVSSALIGVLPTFETAGIVAPILLAVMRFVQGMAAGGEWGGATLLAVENAPESKRGFYGAVVQMGSPTGTILSSMIVAAVVAVSGESFLEGAWRIPYLISILLVVVGVWIRLRVDETDDYVAAQAAREASRAAAPEVKEGLPAVEILRTVPGRLVLGVGTYLFGNAGFFVLTTFMISYVTKQLGMPSTVILTAITWGAVAEIITMGVAGKVADRTSPSIVVVVGYAVAAVLAVPIFLLVDTRSAALITVAMILGIGFASIPYAPVGTMLTQLFPVKVRYSAIALCANIAGVVAGFMPALAAWILGLTGGTSTGPTLLLLALALISLVSSLLARRVIRRDEERDVDQISGDLLNR
ncbi:MFS transporter [Glutamicibacter protophormiae]|uniref:MFS transporter n=1 Tax=Kocuria TaxID=57493 RepID=UPI000F86B605|nr:MULTISPECIES: MFS transporter [unclassified Kocuria]RUP85173.1 MFS transporter [Kocuria sp. HSID17590]RUQ08229.1 MFS transporter [Kocuria sp. HSID17582]WNB88339.1 MFS transporter [Glutamicibacter protophormiae]WTI31945.1 MFS transporter [Kocuria rhizophila]